MGAIVIPVRKGNMWHLINTSTNKVVGFSSGGVIRAMSRAKDAENAINSRVLARITILPCLGGRIVTVSQQIKGWTVIGRGKSVKGAWADWEENAKKFKEGGKNDRTN
jgi:hypothetical protein